MVRETARVQGAPNNHRGATTFGGVEPVQPAPLGGEWVFQIYGAAGSFVKEAAVLCLH